MNDDGPQPEPSFVAPPAPDPGRWAQRRFRKAGNLPSALVVSLTVHAAVLGFVAGRAPRLPQHAGAGGDRGEAEETVAVASVELLGASHLPVLIDAVGSTLPTRPNTTAGPAVPHSPVAPTSHLVAADRSRPSSAATAASTADRSVDRSFDRSFDRSLAVASPSVEATPAGRSLAMATASRRKARAPGSPADAQATDSESDPESDPESEIRPAAATSDAGVDTKPSPVTDARAPELLTLGIHQGEHGGEAAGAISAAIAGNPALAAFIERLQTPIAAQAHLAEVYRTAHPNFRDDRVMGRTTTLLLRLGREGNLESIAVDESSGSPAFDQETIAAVRRARPLPRPPESALDDKGGFSFRFRFHLDLSRALFFSDVNRAIAKRWQPSKAFRRFGGAVDRTTVVRVMVGNTGRIVHHEIQTSAGIDFLDKTTLEALAIGTFLATPPPGMRPSGHLIPIRIKFVHAVRGADLVSAERERIEGRGGTP